MNTGKLLQNILKDVCSEKFGTRIRYGVKPWKMVADNKQWNGFIGVTNNNVLYFIEKADMLIDWKAVNNGVIVTNEKIVEHLNKYNKRINEINEIGDCRHTLILKRIQKEHIYGKNDDVAIFDFYMDKEIAIKMEYLQYFDVTSIQLIPTENDYSPIVIVEDKIVRGIVMPVLK